jgi:uncharacterized protein HemX
VNNVLKIILATIAGLIILVAVVAAGIGTYTWWRECPKAEACSYKEQLLVLQTKTGGTEKDKKEAEDAIVKKASDMANFILATERSKARDNENEELKERIKELEQRLIATSPSARREPSSTPTDPCRLMSEDNRKICEATR